MHNKNLLIDVDECTVVLSPTMEITFVGEWKTTAEEIISTFTRLADLEEIFGVKKDADDTRPLPQGYTKGYVYGDNPFYFAVAFHPDQPKMGVIIKFSATSWSVYCDRGVTNIKRFLCSINSDLYRSRLSRIDFAVDYQNWNFTVNDIYQSLKSQRLQIQNYNGKKNPSSITAHEHDGIASTIYVGSKKSGTRLFLRIYDKQQEQIEKKGSRLQEALITKSWVRFEAVYKGIYAHILTDLIKMTDENKLTDLIADKITEKYRFYDTTEKRYTNFTTALIENSKEDFAHLTIGSTRDNDFLGSIIHLIYGSGLFAILYKCDKVRGEGTSKKLLDFLYSIYIEEYEPNNDVKHWIKEHKKAINEQSSEGALKLLELYNANRKKLL